MEVFEIGERYTAKTHARRQGKTIFHVIQQVFLHCIQTKQNSFHLFI